jgi:monoamine oxidase
MSLCLRAHIDYSSIKPASPTEAQTLIASPHASHQAIRLLNLSRSVFKQLPIISSHIMADGNRAQAIVIGAGLSGLTAASELTRQGIDVIVLEASSNVGGRSRSATTKLGSHLDLGGQWIGRGHDRIAALVDKARGTTYPTFSRGLPTIVRQGRTVSYLSPSVLLAMLYLTLIELVSRTYVPQGWIQLTVDKAIATWVPLEITRQLLRLLVAITSTSELSMCSVSSFVNMIPISGGLLTMFGTQGGAQDRLVVESMSIATSMLAKELSGKLWTHMPVTSITQHDTDEVTVTTASGRQFHARKVIVTVPPPMSKSITFDPPMPAYRKALQQNTRMGVVYKAIAVFEQPFWREGLGGEFLVLDDPACGVFDSSPPDGHGHGPGHLCFLVAGTPARQLDTLDSDARRELLLSRLLHHLGPRVTQPVEWHEKAWHLDENCGGGYLAYPIAGTSEGLLPMPCEPVNNLHWAGTETAQEHPGYLEGAVQSGERAAHEVAVALRAGMNDDVD